MKPTKHSQKPEHPIVESAITLILRVLHFPSCKQRSIFLQYTQNGLRQWETQHETFWTGSRVFGVQERTPGGKHLSCKHEGQSSSPQSPCSKLNMSCACKPSYSEMGDMNRQIPGSLLRGFHVLHGKVQDSKRSSITQKVEAPMDNTKGCSLTFLCMLWIY